ncbi:MAG: DUF4990 domain-containing protein [Bacteroidales bacterium]|nr:DUF4990 domain-containing protein [Bacteroidales bacterium]
MREFSIIVLFSIGLLLQANTYYVSTHGDDSNPGTIDRPFATWEKLSQVLVAGDVAYIRGGTYRSVKGPSAEVVCRWENLNGTVKDTIKIWAYPGESPVLNLDDIKMLSKYCYILFINDCNYLWIKGLRITGLRQTPKAPSIFGMLIKGSSNNIIENCEVDHIGMYGISFGSGSDYNYVINCDVHHLADPYTDYGAANGFNRTGGSTANHLTFSGCRAWLCSDDGWDMFQSDGYLTIENCWAFWNGYLDENKTDAVGGDGMGFKIGPGVNNKTEVTRILRNCLAVENKVHGFNQNFITGVFASHIYNNTAYKNGGTGFEFTYGPGGDNDIFRNNISYANIKRAYNGDEGDIQDHNSWNRGVHVTDADFISLDVSQLVGKRKADGSLPDITLLHLTETSDLIDAGVDIGLPYSGNAPDLGAFEFKGNKDSEVSEYKVSWMKMLILQFWTLF